MTPVARYKLRAQYVLSVWEACLISQTPPLPVSKYAEVGFLRAHLALCFLSFFSFHHHPLLTPCSPWLAHMIFPTSGPAPLTWDTEKQQSRRQAHGPVPGWSLQAPPEPGASSPSSTHCYPFLLFLALFCCLHQPLGAVLSSSENEGSWGLGTSWDNDAENLSKVILM